MCISYRCISVCGSLSIWIYIYIYPSKYIYIYMFVCNIYIDISRTRASFNSLLTMAVLKERQNKTDMKKAA